MVDPKDHPSIGRLERNLGLSFRDKALALEALTHSSRSEGAQRLPDNQRLEFLGDAVLQLAVSNLLFRLRGDLDEGALTRFRASIVNKRSLASVARKLDLPGLVLGGRGLDTDNESVLADCLEALLGAVFLDRSYAAAQILVERLVRDGLSRATHASDAPCDPKSRLQQVSLARWKQLPRYETVGDSTESSSCFHVRVVVGPMLESLGNGRSKKEAEQDAARKMLEALGEAAGAP